SGTPTVAGNASFTITARDANSASSSATYTLTIAPPAVTFGFSPSGGALAPAMAGEEYSQSIVAKGGAGSLIYSLASGTMPAGMVLNVSTGELSGPLDANTEGDYSFAIGVRDSLGSTGAAKFTLKVEARAVTVKDKVVTVVAGATPANVNLVRDATGGPFSSADLLFVDPPNAGTVSIVRGEFAQASTPTPSGWYLKFTPNPSYSGSVRVGYRLTSALGVSNTGFVIYNVGPNSDQVVGDIDALVNGFVSRRQSLIASSIKVPGLMERRRVQEGTDPITTRMSPSVDGVTFGFSTSLAQLGVDGYGADSPFNIWVDGTFMLHNREENGDKWGNFGMISTGADYLVSDKFLVGLSFHYDHMTDPTDEDAELTGNGWLAGPYSSVEIGKNTFWDTHLLYGGSSNTIDTTFWDGDFDTNRWMFDTSLKGQLMLPNDILLLPKLRTVYLSESIDDYAVTNSDGDMIELEGHAEEQFRVNLGAEIAREFTLENKSILTPKLGVTAGYSGIDGSGAFGSLSAGLSLKGETAYIFNLGLLFSAEGDGEMSAGMKAGLNGRF
ncbi:autotransporter outer membrane beta-barrel domain-containing protein, partial [Rhizobium sp. CFBP 13717]